MGPDPRKVVVSVCRRRSCFGLSVACQAVAVQCGALLSALSAAAQGAAPSSAVIAAAAAPPPVPSSAARRPLAQSSAVVLPMVKTLHLETETKMALVFDSAFSDVLCILELSH